MGLEFENPKGGGAGSTGSVIGGSLTNGNIKVDTVELKVYDDTNIANSVAANSTSLAQNLQQNAKPLESFGTVTGTTDDYATLMIAHANLSAGDILLISNPVMLMTPVVWTKKIDIQCIGDKGYFIANVGNTNDALTIKGTGINNVNLKINIYGLANCCKNALVVDSVNLSTITAKIFAGAVNYGYVSKGCLSTTHNIHISVNYSCPLVGAVIPTNHILLDTSAVVATESNSSKFNFKLEGGGNGVTKTNTNKLASVLFTGMMEGLTGTPFNLIDVSYFNINDLYLEANGQDSVFTNCVALTIESVRNNTFKFDFVNTTGIDITGYVGSLQFDATCTGKVKSITFDSLDTIVNNSIGVSVDGVVTDLSNALVYGLNNIGKDTLENFFHNPFMDIWSLGANAVPDEWKGTNLTWAKETTIVYPNNPKKVSAYVQSVGTAITDGATSNIVPEFQTMNFDRWVSFTLPLFVPTGQPNLRVYLYDVSQYIQIKPDITVKNTWVLVTGSAFIPAGKALSIAVRVYNGTSFLAGNYYIGGLSIFNSLIPSNKLMDNGKRNEYVVTSVSFAPAFIGQKALVAGKWYMAQNTTASTDWIILN